MEDHAQNSFALWSVELHLIGHWSGFAVLLQNYLMI